MKLATAILAVLIVSGAAHAQRESKVTGTKLLSLCTASAAANCDAYLSGVADAIAAEGPAHAPACIPDAVTGRQLRDVVVKYIHDHPQEQELKAGTIAMHAYAGAFACHK